MGWTPGFKKNLYGRSSSYGRWSADVFGTLMPQACTVCLGRDQRSTDALRLRDLRRPNLYRDVLEKCIRERESACERAMRVCIRVLQPVKRRRFCSSDAQACTDTLERSLDGSAAPVEAPTPGPYTDVPGRMPSACIGV